MAKKKAIVIKNLTQFFDEIKKFKTGKDKVWYRGHSEKDYKLEPSIYRDPFKPSSEQELINQFKSRAIHYLKNIPDKDDDWEWLFLMQHYKLPTRLLDWTESAVVGLAFALIYREDKKRDSNKEGAHIWCLDPFKLNLKFNQIKGEVPNITVNPHAQAICGKDHLPTFGDMKSPVAIYGPQNNPRIVGQKGVFTVFPSKEKFIYDDHITEDIGIKINIKTDAQVKKIALELYDIGISESMIFPELDSISLEIKREYSNFKKTK